MQTFAEAKKVLAEYMSPKNLKDIYTLGRMVKLMEALGNPQDKLKVIHVAGTSGKTSTCYFITSLLKTAGQKVGLTISPHIDEVNERIQINLEPLPEAQFCSKLAEFIKEVKKTGVKPTYFELLAAFAFWYFAKIEVDYAVVEVGLGGLLDGTNVINRGDKVSVITDIGLDHQEVLGESLSKIATQKAGIIKPGNTVFTINQPAEVTQVIKSRALNQQADLNVVPDYKDTEHDLDALPSFQRRNWWLALSVFDHVTERDNLPMLSPIQIRDTMQTYIPARMESVKHRGKTIILDGAHNAQKMRLLAEAVREKFPSESIATLIAIKASHDFVGRIDLEPIVKLSNYILVTEFSGQQDFPVKSVDGKIVAEHCHKIGALEVKTIPKPEAALKALMGRPEQVLLVTGSFYLMNHIRPLLKPQLRT